MKWVYAVVLAYVAGFALFRPRVLLVSDEEQYVGQAMAFSVGTTSLPGTGIVYPAPPTRAVSNYPPGTSLLQTPFVWAFGWRGAALLSVLSLAVATILTARWLASSGRNPAFALIIPGFAGAALFGRIAMSDLPATAIVAVSCFLLYAAGQRAGATRSAAAAFTAGTLLLFREPPLFVVAPLFIAALWKRQVHPGGAIAGGIAAAALRLGVAQLMFGTPFYVRDPGPGFSLASLSHSIPIYAFLLLVMLPAGALLPLLYRGPHRMEMLAAFCAYLTIFLLFGSNSVEESGLAKGVMIASRYMTPLLPLLAYQAADVWPRALAALRARWRIADWLPTAACAAVVALAFLIHPAVRRLETVPLTITRTLLDHTREGQAVITNTDATLKYLGITYGRRSLVARYRLSPDSIAALATRYGSVSVAFLDRRDSENFRRDSDGNDLFLAAARDRCVVRATYDSDVASWARVRTFDLDSCHP